MLLQICKSELVHMAKHLLEVCCLQLQTLYELLHSTNSLAKHVAYLHQHCHKLCTTCVQPILSHPPSPYSLKLQCIAPSLKLLNCVRSLLMLMVAK